MNDFIGLSAGSPLDQVTCRIGLGVTTEPLSASPPRRHYLTEPGQVLLAPVDPVEMLDRIADFCRDSGVAVSDLVVSRIGAFPVPVKAAGGTPQDYPELNAELAWHPVFWLPPEMTLRATLTDDDGTIWIETDDEWATRVLLTLELAKIYDPETGWIDMLAIAGIDLSVPADAARFETWMAGGADEILDALEVGDLLPGDRALEWEVATAGAILARTMPGAYAVAGLSLAQLADDYAHDGTDPAFACYRLSVLGGFAYRDSDDPDAIDVFRSVTNDPDGIPDPPATFDRIRGALTRLRDQWAYALPATA